MLHARHYDTSSSTKLQISLDTSKYLQALNYKHPPGLSIQLFKNNHFV